MLYCGQRLNRKKVFFNNLLVHLPLSVLEGICFFSVAREQSSLCPGWTCLLVLGASIQSAPAQCVMDTWCFGPSCMLFLKPRFVTFLLISYVSHWFGFSWLTDAVVSAATRKTHKRDRKDYRCDKSCMKDMDGHNDIQARYKSLHL